MDVPIVVVAFHQLIVNINGTLVITIVEGTVSNSKVGFQIMSVGVLSVTFEKR